MSPRTVASETILPRAPPRRACVGGLSSVPDRPQRGWKTPSVVAAATAAAAA